MLKGLVGYSIVTFLIGIIGFGLATSAFALECPPKESEAAKGYIYLNTNIPFIGQCIKKTADPNSQDPTAGNAFGLLLGGLMKIAMTAVLIVAFLAVLIGGVMIAGGGMKSEWLSSGKKLIVSVILGILLLGVSGIILNVINPNFFKTESGLILRTNFSF